MTYEHGTTQVAGEEETVARELDALKAVEKTKADRRERSRLESLWWAGALIWAGLVFAADGLGLLPQIGASDAWSWVFLGAGLYGTLGNLYRVTNPSAPNPVAWDYIWAGGLLLIGVGGMSPVDIFWPLVLVLVGVVVLADTLFQRR